MLNNEEMRDLETAIYNDSTTVISLSRKSLVNENNQFQSSEVIYIHT